MRVLPYIYFFLILATPAFAYVEENNVGMANMSAGEQNTNMYKLNTRTEYLVKQLKRIDEYAAKNKNDVSAFDISKVEDISVIEQKDREKLQNKKFLEEITKAAATPATLKEVIKPDVYSSLTMINQIKDRETVALLQRQLRGMRR